MLNGIVYLCRVPNAILFIYSTRNFQLGVPTISFDGRGDRMKDLSAEILNEVTRRIASTVKPEKIILFGSHAWGEPTESSDLDLFVIVPSSDQPAYRRTAVIYRALRGIGVPVEVIVQTHDEVERSRKVPTSLSRKVLEQGRVLHG
jgi:predicted nucleotidyltransferase